MRAAFLFGFFLAGCAAEPVPYHSGNEIPKGPGLLTGPQGEFVLRVGESAAPRNADEEREYREWRESKRKKPEAATQ